MNPKVCLLLAVGLLLGALATGNPFLAVPMRAAASPPVTVPAHQPLVDLGSMAAPAVTAVPASFRTRPDLRCPDAALDDLVECVIRLTDGSPCWVLRDGRWLRQDPASPTRLVAVPADPALERGADEAPR
ncbi:MAG: hypothetical protein IPK26_05930 [Planctomycetes bacterium]|nr:hypothetical protein [Planctomycetota bacterium]